MNDKNATLLLVVSAIVTPIITLLTLMWKDRQARLREVRIHNWDVQDRERIALRAETERERVSAHLATKVEDARIQVAAASVQHVKEIRDDIKENTRKTVEGQAAAVKAYDEANHANEKIADLNERLLAREGEKP